MRRLLAMTELGGTYGERFWTANSISCLSRTCPLERYEDTLASSGSGERIRPRHACDHEVEVPVVVHAADISRRLELRNRGTDATKAPAMESMVSPPISDLRLRLLRRRDRRARGHLCRLTLGLLQRLPRVLPPDEAARGYRSGRQGSGRGRARVGAKGRLDWSARPAPGPYLKACFHE